MDWLAALAGLRQAGEPCVLVTVLRVRGHAPRDPGAKMVVTPEHTYGSVGGGNLEAESVDAARALLVEGATPETGTAAARALPPRTVALGLSEHAPTRHGRQCCGGAVEVLLEHLPARRAVAVFGAGHVGLELCRVLTRHDLTVHLVDSRADRLALADDIPPGPAELVTHHSPAPESVIPRLPRGVEVLVMTHDHAEDLAVVDAALRSPVPGRIGMIGSSAKWARFQVRLAREGHAADAIARVRCPVGLPDVAGKEPAVIAVSVAAELLGRADRAAASGHAGPRPLPGAGAAS